ncbi:MAG: hypothetical protein K0Q71_5055 [Thermomicrobiales bacterium]|nr:hypothetical protein [Thermomicrobiales bacterium]
MNLNEGRCDALTRSVIGVPSRRDVLRGLAIAGLGFGAARRPLRSMAARKKRKKKGRPNAFGCLNVGKPCTNAARCCSGICQRKKCRAHDTGICVAGDHSPGCGGDASVGCATSLGKAGMCGTTTGNAGYCFASGECFACRRDAECQAVENGKYGPRAACVRCALECAHTGGTACAGPDTIEIPV